MTLTEALIAIVIVIGLVGIVVPVLPGSVLIIAAILVWAITTGGVTAWLVFVVATALVVAGTVIKYAVPGRQLQASGVPTTTLLVGGIAALVGFFVIPVVGLVVGFIGGVYLAERQRVGQTAAWPSTVAALKAVGLSIAIEFTSALLAAVAWVVGVVVT